MPNRSQSAIEIITTYGVIFVSIAIVLGALYFLTAFPGTALGSSCNSFGTIKCLDVAYISKSSGATTVYLKISSGQTGILNISSFQSTIGGLKSVSGACIPAKISEGQSTICYANFTTAYISKSQVYAGSFALQAGYCSPGSSSCASGTAYNFTGAFSVQASNSTPPIVLGPRVPGTNISINSTNPLTETYYHDIHGFAVASSLNGSRLVVASSCGWNATQAKWLFGNVSTSANYGATWTNEGHPGCYQAAASSSNGMNLVVAGGFGNITTSNTFGVTWSGPNTSLETPAQQLSISNLWTGLASSYNGSRLVAIRYMGNISTSNNSGVTWTPRPSDLYSYWQAVTSSSNGTRLAAVEYGGQVYTSNNVGVTWTLTSAPYEDWDSIASSSNGTDLVATAYGQYIYRSTNFGATWAATSAPAEPWEAIASSANGNVLVAVSGTINGTGSGGDIFISNNSGATWSDTGHTHFWNAVTISADGSRIAALAYSSHQGIYTYWLNGN